MEVLKATGRLIYCTAVDAPIQLMSNVGNANSLTLFAQNTLRAMQYYCKDSDYIPFDMNEGAQLLKSTRETLGLLLTLKSWSDITKLMEKKPTTYVEGKDQPAKSGILSPPCSVKSLSIFTGTIEKTIAMLLTLDKFGAHTIASCIQFDATYLSGVAAKIGSSELFVRAGMTTLKGFRDKMILCTSTLRIIDASMTLYQRTYHPKEHDVALKDPKKQAALTRELRAQEHAKLLFFLQCSCEIGKMSFICIGGSVSGGIVLFGVCSAMMPIAKTLYTTYVIEQREVNYPNWLKSTS